MEESGSFRDPAGRVFYRGGRVFRTVSARAADDFRAVWQTGFVQRLAAEGKVAGTRIAEEGEYGQAPPDAACVLAHERIPFVSYPYEWCFAALQSAALLHLDVQIEALAAGVVLSDASAYNVQFNGARPVFIDVLSFRPYVEGAFWPGQRQFTEQFLVPLLLHSAAGIPHNEWYRGFQEGIPADCLLKVLPVRRLFSGRMLMYIALPVWFQARSARATDIAKLRELKLSRDRYRGMLRDLRDWIARLNPRARRSAWRDYVSTCSYSDEESGHKREFVQRIVSERRPRVLWDLGCNTGAYARAALEAGAGYVVGFDMDHGALDAAYREAARNRRPFLPLVLDCTNPSPDQGWRQIERMGLQRRAGSDFVLALALVHHLAISRNVPFDQLVEWLAGLAPEGIVEFVPKDDPLVKSMLALREDIFQYYTRENFLSVLSRRSFRARVGR